MLKGSVLSLPITTSQYFYCYSKPRSSVALDFYSQCFRMLTFILHQCVGYPSSHPQTLFPFRIVGSTYGSASMCFVCRFSRGPFTAVLQLARQPYVLVNRRLIFWELNLTIFWLSFLFS